MRKLDATVARLTVFLVDHEASTDEQNNAHNAADNDERDGPALQTRVLGGRYGSRETRVTRHGAAGKRLELACAYTYMTSGAATRQVGRTLKY